MTKPLVSTRPFTVAIQSLQIWCEGQVLNQHLLLPVGDELGLGSSREFWKGPEETVNSAAESSGSVESTEPED